MMGIWEGLLLLICLGLTLLLFLLIYVVWTTTSNDPYRKIPSYPGEESFVHGKTRERFPSLLEEDDEEEMVDLSVVVPAYNEEQRLPAMLEETTDYLEKRLREGNFTYEILVVDDGSKDETTKVAHRYGQRLNSAKFRVCTLSKNRGKGGAVRMGVLRSRGRKILFADADGATRFSELDKLEAVMKDRSSELVCGSRAHMEKDSIATRSAFRTLLMKGFHFAVYLFGSKSIQDTQCGFKLMTRDFAKLAFMNLHIERWAFDVELIKIAEMTGRKTSEVAVKWTEIDGSKLDPVSASIQMLKDLFFLWMRYSLKLWIVKPIDADDKKRV